MDLVLKNLLALRGAFEFLVAQRPAVHSALVLASETSRAFLGGRDTFFNSSYGDALSRASENYVLPVRRSAALTEVCNSPSLANAKFLSDGLTYQDFRRLSRDAGNCLRRIAASKDILLRLPETIAPELVLGDISFVKEHQQWLLFLHVLGWQNLRDSPIRAARFVWDESSSLEWNDYTATVLASMHSTNEVAARFSKIPFPPPYFESELHQSATLASVYAIDLLLSNHLNRPSADLGELSRQLNSLSPGHADAHAYARLMATAIEVIFFDQLSNIRIEAPVDEGRKRIDFIADNVAEGGFFHDLIFRHSLKCPIVVFECKNHTGDLDNPDFDQIAGRLSDRIGRVAILLCRSKGDREKTLKRCRDAMHRGHCILVLDDNDIHELLRLAQNRDSRPVSSYLRTEDLITSQTAPAGE